jgi:signal transduction histidine kinase
MNLLENSIKFTPQGGEVYIDLADLNNSLCIIFKDTGIGIAPDDLPNIFDRFYRVDRSRAHAGLGLGLSLVKAIVESLGGTITVHSALNSGSIFNVTIPI